MDGTAGRPFALLLQGDRPNPLSPFQQAMDGNRFLLALDKTANHPRDGLAGLAVDQRETDTAEFFLKQAAAGGGHHAQAPNQDEKKTAVHRSGHSLARRFISGSRSTPNPSATRLM